MTSHDMLQCTVMLPLSGKITHRRHFIQHQHYIKHVRDKFEIGFARS